MFSTSPARLLVYITLHSQFNAGPRHARDVVGKEMPNVNLHSYYHAAIKNIFHLLIHHQKAFKNVFYIHIASKYLKVPAKKEKKIRCQEIEKETKKV